MTGEKAQNSLPQPTTISMEGLNDWTITDIATAPKTAPEDRVNAEAEIIRRQQNNEYNPDTASRDVRTDMLRNDYGMENGKILYPKDESRSLSAVVYCAVGSGDSIWHRWIVYRRLGRTGRLVD